MQWVTENRLIDGVERDCRILNFAIDAGTVGGIICANSNGVIIDPDGTVNPPNSFMFERFDITIDQLEGEINCPYIFRREFPDVDDDLGTLTNNTEIIVPHSLLGGFAQFRINYQFILYPSDPQAEQSLVDLDGDGNLDGIVYNGSFETPRTLVPRRVADPPPPPPPVFTIDEGQIKEALADKIYEKFFTSEIIEGDISDLLSLQTTTSTDGIGYNVGRQSEDDQLILFKKDRNTPENKKDFEGDGSDGIQAIANIISGSLAFSDANGVVDLTEILDEGLSITSTEKYPNGSRISSLDPNYFDPPIFKTPQEGVPAFYLEITKYNLLFTKNDDSISVEFAELWRYYEQAEGLGGLDPKADGRPDEWKNQLNISQLTKAKPSNRIDVQKALATLDTNIFELLPARANRQQDINSFFDLFNQLIGTAPNFDDGNEDNIPETITNEQTDLDRRISTATDELYPQSFITRTDEDADEINEGKTLETMRNRLNQFLFDIDSVVEEVPDSRPEYVNQSSGFLKLRRLNQSILIKGSGDTPSFGNWEQDGFTITMWVRFLNTTGGGSLFTYGNPMMRTKSSFRLETMTVQQGDLADLSRTNTGPYTYAKPRRIVRLVVWEDRRDDPWWQEKLTDNDMAMAWAKPAMPYQRRAGYTWDSSVPYNIPQSGVFMQENGTPISTHSSFREGLSKMPTWFTQMPADMNVRRGSAKIPWSRNFLQYTDIPTDNLDEWFFICATYDPSISEIKTFGSEIGQGLDFWPVDWPLDPYGNFTEFISDHPDIEQPGTAGFNNSADLRNELIWLGHLEPGGTSAVSRSGVGNKCKVEIISRSDLLRARGYKV